MNCINCKNIEDFYNNFKTEDYNNFLTNIIYENTKNELIRKKKSFYKIFFLKFRKKHLVKKFKDQKIMLGNSLWDYAKDIFVNKLQYKLLYDFLCDNKSKQTLLDILSYKVTFNRDYLKNNIRPTQDQYLDSNIMSFSDKEVIVDCGAYIGDNILTYFKYMKTASKYYAIEPDKDNIEIAKRIMSEEKYKNIEYYTLATGNENKTMKFTSFGAGSYIDTQGKEEINIVRIDDFIKEPITFIKMDIEGSEIDTLKGALNQIKNNKPKLAICAYHKPDDLWKIPQYVLSIRNDYKVYLRLYLSTFCESVLYFV